MNRNERIAYNWLNTRTRRTNDRRYTAKQVSNGTSLGEAAARKALNALSCWRDDAPDPAVSHAEKSGRNPGTYKVR